MIKKCLLCGNEFVVKGYQKYCGNYRIKGTCAYKNRHWASTQRNKKWRKENPEKWKRNDRKYKIRHKDKIKEYTRKPEVKEKKRIREKNQRLRLRFQIFQRDSFTCQYCGRKAPEVILEIDHRFPKSKGGLDNINNYITSCRECNLGKGDIILKEFNK